MTHLTCVPVPHVTATQEGVGPTFCLACSLASFCTSLSRYSTLVCRWDAWGFLDFSTGRIWRNKTHYDSVLIPPLPPPHTHTHTYVHTFLLKPREGSSLMFSQFPRPCSYTPISSLASSTADHLTPSHPTGLGWVKRRYLQREFCFEHEYTGTPSVCWGGGGACTCLILVVGLAGMQAVRACSSSSRRKMEAVLMVTPDNCKEGPLSVLGL